jgi:hypothetical protein
VKALISEQTVRDPGGREWKVGIRWLSRRPRWLGWGPGRRNKQKQQKDSDWSWLDVADPGCMPDELPVLGAIVAVVIIVLLLWFAVLPIAVFALDLLFLLLIAAGGVGLRVFFRRPWIVEATTRGDTRHWPVVGFRSSKRMVGEVSWALQNGRALEEL